MWYDLDTGRARSVPDVLAAYGWLTSEAGRQELADPTPDTQRRLVELLRGAARQSGDVPALTQLAEHVAAVHYSSPAFQQLVETARVTLPRHFRGEYGAKLTLLDTSSQQPVLESPGAEPAIRAYLRESASGDAALLPELWAAIHANRRPQTLHCTDCHTAAGGLLDCAAAGYPAARLEELSRPGVFTMIEHIAGGQPFQLPGFCGRGASAVAPAPRPSVRGRIGHLISVPTPGLKGVRSTASRQQARTGRCRRRSQRPTTRMKSQSGCAAGTGRVDKASTNGSI